MLHRLRPLPLALALGLGLGAAPALAEEEAPNADTVVATVDGNEITLGHMIVLRAGLPAQLSQLPPAVLYKGILDQLIQQAIMENNFEGELSKAAKLSLENERRALIAGETINRVANVALTEEALQKVYEDTYMTAEAQTEFNAAHILVETEEEAKALIEELNGGADFSALAKEKSTGPSGPNGGELDWFAGDMMVEPFAEAVAKMEKGAISEPVQTQFGWHVIKLNDTRTKERPELEEVRAELEEVVRQQAIDAYMTDLSEGAKVDREAGDALDPEILLQTDLLEE
ncbi:MAG: peptidylprolyl isomerase [Roseovarius sp.]|nr:peptidylprolyl isomerase [Roseovarius sp.]